MTLCYNIAFGEPGLALVGRYCISHKQNISSLEMPLTSKLFKLSLHQGMKFSANLQNSINFRVSLVIPEISITLVRNLKDCIGGGGSQELLAPSEMVHLLKFTEFDKEMYQSLFNIVAL